MGHENSNPRTSAPHPAAQAGLEEWHRIVTERDWEQLPALLVDDVTYHNPAQFEPYRAKDALGAYSQAAWARGEKDRFHPYGKSYARALADQGL